MLIWLLVIAGVIILDQVSKIVMMNIIPVDEPIVVIDGFFRLSQVKNTGAAFGMLGGENQRWIFIVVSIIGIAVLIAYLWKFRPKSKWACAALSMVIGGGIGNMIDRCFRVGTVHGEERHYVFDFIDFYGIWPYVFNIADAFVCVGAAILMVWCIYSFVVEIKAEKQKKLAVGDAVNENESAVDNNSANDGAEDAAEENKQENTEEN